MSEPEWRGYWQGQYRGAYGQRDECRLVSWLQDYWNDYITPNSLGRAAAALGWGASRTPGVQPRSEPNVVTSFDVLTKDPCTEFRAGCIHSCSSARLAFFQSIHDRYRGSIRMLGSHCLWLQDECYRTGAAHRPGATSVRREQQNLRRNLIHWRASVLALIHLRKHPSHSALDCLDLKTFMRKPSFLLSSRSYRNLKMCIASSQ